LPRWIKALQQRLRRILGVLALVAISAALLIWARLSEGFTRDVLVNIGASVVIVAMSYAIFNPLFQELRRSRVEERPSFGENHAT
jgi:peptidoglycan/LPS O-acetylase OafA/YrhL